MKKIDELTGEAYETAIKQVAIVINAHLNTNLTYRDNWSELDDLARYFNIQFNDNGQIQ